MLAAWVGPVADAFTGPVAQRTEAPPSMPLPLSGPVLLLVLASVALVLVARRRRRRGEGDGYRRWAGGAGVGNALMEFNGVFAPHHPDAAVVQMLEEEPLQDEIGVQPPRDPP